MALDSAPTTQSRSDRPIMSAAFSTGFVIAVICCAIATGLALYSPAGPTSGPPFATVVIALTLTCGLALLAAIRLFRVLARKVGGAPTPRLHLRFVALFSFAAVTPAVLMAVFFGVLLSRGIETWFGERVEDSVRSVAATAQFYQDQIIRQTALDVETMASDLGENRALFESNPETFSEGFAASAQVRAFQAAYLINSSNERFISYGTGAEPDYRAPTPEQFADAAQQVTVQVDREAEAFRALVRVEDYPDAYLYAVPDVNPEIFDALGEAEAAIATFNAARAERGQIERLFYLIYLAAALLILSGSVWLALSAAARVADPVGRLVEAADRVRRGNLSTQVEVSDEEDEVSALGRAFNLMTGQIARQRQELIDANSESEGRRRLIEAVLLGVSAGVLSIDAQGRVRLANRSAEYLLGAEEGALIDRPLSEIAEGLGDLAERARARPGGTVQQEIELTRDGVALVFNVRAALDRESDGERVVLTFDDITRLITAQRNAAWRDVARRIAHEIKNPLTPIQLSAERLRRRYRPSDDAGAEIFDRCTETIIRQVGDIGRMVDEFSAFARMPTPHIVRSSLEDLVKEGVFSRRVASPGIRVTLDLPQPPVTVHCDARLANQALSNVLKNSAESLTEQTADGQPPSEAQIDVRIYVRGDQGVIEVQDNGRGWPAGSRERLTEPYMTTREKGTGLGLAIVQRIMEDHRGALELDGRADGEQGAVVRLAFPLADEVSAVEAAE